MWSSNSLKLGYNRSEGWSWRHGFVQERSPRGGVKAVLAVMVTESELAHATLVKENEIVLVMENELDLEVDGCPSALARSVSSLDPPVCGDKAMLRALPHGPEVVIQLSEDECQSPGELWGAVDKQHGGEKSEALVFGDEGAEGLLDMTGSRQLSTGWEK